MAPSSAVSAPTTAARLAWLDALRGWAALAVALHHASYVYLPGLQTSMSGWFDPGRYGVLVFFLVSGYIIPASLERHGDVRAFWVGRFFRIYPLFAVACAFAVLPFVLGVRGLRGGLESFDPAAVILSHLTMLQDVLAVPNMMNVLWTLSYEMAFYLLVVALFVTGGHRRSVPVALVTVAAALLLGGLLPTALLSGAAGTGTVVVVATAAFLVAIIGAAVSGHPAVRVASGLLGGVLALVLVLVNGRIPPWEGLVVLAVMFTGTVVYRAEHGQIPRRTAGYAAGAVLVAAVAAGVVNLGADQGDLEGWRAQILWTGAMVGAAVTFAAGWRLRRCRFPRWATVLGAISFSVYLLHPLLIMVSAQFLRTPATPDRPDLPGAAAFVVALLAISWAAHRWIEAPAQRLGRRLARSPRNTPADTPPPLPVPAAPGSAH